MSERVLVTSALPYANGFLHLGHVASTYIPGDVFARFKRLRGSKVLYVCATDEHGTPIEVNASKNGLEPEVFVKKIHDEMEKDFKSMGISFDVFYRTHTKMHKEMVDEFFLSAKKDGRVKEKEIEAVYCNNCERFLPDRYIKGVCPFCKAEDQYGDQCEVCGKTYTPNDLIEPRCVLCGSKDSLVRKKTRHYIFDLKSFSKDLEEWLDKGEFQKDVVNYVRNWIKEGLKEWDITRDKPYFGINILDEEDKFYYVWFDAPVGYVSSTRKVSKEWKEFWEKGEIYHFIGKDIMYHHYLFWPAMLKVKGYRMPKHIPTRGYLTINGEKMSKSKGTFITLRDALANFDSDYYRFYFAVNTPDKNVDVDFSWKEFQKVVNKVLLGEVGNLINRILSFRVNNYGTGVLDEKYLRKVVEDKMREKMESYFSRYIESMERTEIRKGMEIVLEMVRELNSEFQDCMPWKKIKEDKERTLKIMDSFVYCLGYLDYMLKPFIPKVIEELEKSVEFEFDNGVKRINIKDKGKPLIKKIEDKDIELVEGKDMVSKLDLRVARITEVKEVEGSDKLYKLRLDLGGEERQVVSGIRDYYRKGDLLGRKVVLVYNLKEAKIRGVLSQGMILAGENDKDVRLLSVDAKEGSFVEFEGIPRMPKKVVSIKEFSKVRMEGKDDNVYYKGRKMVVKKGYEWVSVNASGMKGGFLVR